MWTWVCGPMPLWLSPDPKVRRRLAELGYRTVAEPRRDALCLCTDAQADAAHVRHRAGARAGQTNVGGVDTELIHQVQDLDLHGNRWIQHGR